MTLNATPRLEAAAQCESEINLFETMQNESKLFALKINLRKWAACSIEFKFGRRKIKKWKPHNSCLRNATLDIVFSLIKSNFCNKYVHIFPGR